MTTNQILSVTSPHNLTPYDMTVQQAVDRFRNSEDESARQYADVFLNELKNDGVAVSPWGYVYLLTSKTEPVGAFSDGKKQI